MGKSREHRHHRAKAATAADGDPALVLQKGGPTLPAYPPSPSSTSSSDFEFTVSLSPTSRRAGAANLCPADELFYKGQLLPLHLSPRLSMVRSLLLASPSSSSCSGDSTTTASRDSSGSSNDSTVSAFSADVALALAAGECDSSRPSSVTEEDAARVVVPRPHHHHRHHKYLSSLATRFSSVFHRKKDPQQKDHVAAQAPPETVGGDNDEAVAQVRISGRKTAAAAKSGSPASTSSAKDVFKKYVKKVKPLYEKLEKLSALQQHKNNQQQQHKLAAAAARQELRKKTFSFSVRRGDKSAMDPVIMSASASRKERETEDEEEEHHDYVRAGGAALYTHSFSGNLRHLRRKQCAAAASCPSSMRSSPSHSGLLHPRDRGCGGGITSMADPATASVAFATCRPPLSSWSSSSSMEELQSAIQGAIAHCKSTMAAPSNQKKLSTAVSEQI